MDTSQPPLLVIEDDEQLFEEAVAELEARGWSVARGRVESERPGVVLAIDVQRAADARAALLAALSGMGLIVSVNQADDGAATFLEDLRRIGPIEIRGARASRPLELDPAQRRILQLLAEGWRVNEIARELHVSRRTTDRRLAEVRRALGASTTADAVSRARRLGLC
jgi:DNA-binding NarL/FixJ family response regulator